jgi:hypothetical protein
MEHARRKLLSIFGLTIPGAVFAGAARSREDAKPADDLADLRAQVDQLRKDLGELQGKNKDNADDIATLSRIDPPVGTVMAFAGDWPPKKDEMTSWSEKELGWLKCDGRSLAKIRQELDLGDDDLKPIRLILSGDSVPDYQGYFLRGIDRKVSDPKQRRDPDGLRTPNSKVQDWATGKPRSAPWTTDERGSHIHSLSCSLNTGHVDSGGWEFSRHDNRDWTEGDVNQKMQGMKPAGQHTHSISGGDAETRPSNVAVYWIIKFKSK